MRALLTGLFSERFHEAWTEVRENLGRSVLQSLGVVLGVASVLGGFSISDSQRRRSEVLFVRMGGLDKLNVQPSEVVKEGRPTALQTANLGLRRDDRAEGEELDRKTVSGASEQKSAQARVRSPWADQERQVTGIGGDFLALDGYVVEKGREFTDRDLASAAPVALLGSEAAATFFPTGEPVGGVLRIGDAPVTVVGVLRERVFRFREQGRNIFRRRNRIVALPATLVAQRFEGDVYHRLDRVTFRIRNLDAMSVFSKSLSGMLKANHRQQEDFRLDDVAARIRKERSQGDVYDLIFMLSGILSLLGGGIVNVNIQMAALKERVREVGVKMAIGAPGREIFREFMTEAMLLTAAGSVAGLAVGVAFSKIITSSIGIPLFMEARSFLWAAALAGAFGFVFALYPAFKASRLSPMEALRYE
jgi:ABC-type antimicrobial peptide transport system permease subunit